MRPAVLTAVLLSVLFINAVTSLNLGEYNPSVKK